MILLLCDCKSWSSLANQLYHHQSNDETERMRKIEMGDGERETGRIGEKLILVYIVKDFPIFLLLTLLIHFYSIGAVWMALLNETDRICALLSERASVCVCAHYFQFNSTHTDERNINEKTKDITFIDQTISSTSHKIWNNCLLLKIIHKLCVFFNLNKNFTTFSVENFVSKNLVFGKLFGN